MNLNLLGVLALALVACHPVASPGPSDASPPPPPPSNADGGATDATTSLLGTLTNSLVAANYSKAPTTVYIAFGSDSVVKSWPFCTTDSGFAGCVFTLKAGETRTLPPAGCYLNATISFGGNGCGTTKAEINLNNPAWKNDTADVSLVDGYSNSVTIEIGGGASDGGWLYLGPPAGKTGNEQVSGLFPYGCDICVARQAPPCGIPACGSSPNDGGQACGCKSGSQYNPAVPCQWSGPRGLSYFVALR